MNSIFYKTLSIVALVVATCISITSCDDTTGEIGLGVMPSTDQSTTSQVVFDVKTASVEAGPLVAFTSECYLGRVTDPETNATTTCDFLAQFYNLEDYKLPEASAMHKEDGKIAADSVLINLYIRSYYGDSVNSMKIGVYELNKENIMTDEKIYTTDINPEDYISKAPDAVKKELSFAVTDFAIDDTIRFASNYNKNVRIKLPTEYGTRILQAYYEHPEYFKNSYSFIKNLVPGFYFKTLSGNGTMLDIDVSTLTVFFRYTDGNKEYEGLQRVAATGEVIQNNHIENTNIEQLLNATEYTFLKSPAGIFTEVTLPVDEIFKGHENDSINSAKIVFGRHNNAQQTSYNLPIPQQILMLRKSVQKSFFEDRLVPNGYTSYVSKFSSAYNSYTFDNIGSLITYLDKLRKDGAGIKSTDSEAIRQTKLTTWEAANPDWNKVLLIPVTTSTNSLGTIIRVNHDLSLASTKLIGGKDNPISITVVYSGFSK